MEYALKLVVLSISLSVITCLNGGIYWLLVWPALNLLVLGLAHARGFHHLHAKRPDGTLPLWSKAIHLPFFLLASGVWSAYRILSREAAWNQVTDHLIIGRRLLSNEDPGKVVNFIDLTSEFEEPAIHRRQKGYICFPMLDGSTVPASQLLDFIAGLKPGKTYIHCAQGHGRTGVLAIALLLHTGQAKSVDEALQILRRARPGVRLNGLQKRTVEEFAELLNR